jgi:DNA-binding transcriptional MerR regulator
VHVYRTATVAKIIGIHPNTVRLYESLGFIQKPNRQENGYRIYTDAHIAQIRLVRTGFQIEILQSGLRKKIIRILLLSGSGLINEAINLTGEYINQIIQEKNKAEQAIRIVRQLVSETDQNESLYFSRRQAAKALQVSEDTLRNWERNGLLAERKKHRGYCIYTESDIKRLKIIRVLRCANYSHKAIFNMVRRLSYFPDENIRDLLDTPDPNDEIISVCDKLITSLQTAEENARSMLGQLHTIRTLLHSESSSKS